MSTTLLDSQPPNALSPVFQDRLVALLDSPRALPPTFQSRLIALLNSQPPTALPFTPQDRPAEMLDFQAPYATPYVSSASRQPVRSELQGTSTSSLSSREPTEAIMDLQRANSVSLRSEASAAIDQVPHRPPPMHDFEAYNDYVARLSDQEYFEMFNCPFPGGTPASMSGSDVDSNERYVRDYTHEEDHLIYPRVPTRITPLGAVRECGISSNTLHNECVLKALALAYLWRRRLDQGQGGASWEVTSH